jgi:hypothetical protein
MTDTLSYADALKILGCKDSRLVKVVEFASTAALTGWALAGGADLPLGLRDLQEDAVRYGNDVVRRVPEWRSGAGRFARTQRLAAVHVVVIVSAYFEALGQASLPFGLDRLDRERVGGGTRVAAFAELVEKLLTERLPMPEPHRPYAETRQEVERRFRRMSEAVAVYVREVAAWDELSSDERIRVPLMLVEGPSAHALRIYDEDYHSLSLDSPEFRMWSLVTEAQPLPPGLSRVARLLAELAPPRVGDRPMTHLVRMAASALDQPLMAVGKAPDGVTLPLLGEGYVSPRCRVAELTSEAAPAAKSWWRSRLELTDAEAFLVGHLTSLHATQAPLVVLGEPGSGKTKLAEVLAARLAASEFLPIKVELRDVAAESSVVSQIEQGMRPVLEEKVRFRDLVEAGEGTLPVVMLDGFDELLQAANANRYDYLEQVQEFQREQAALGHPVAVIVTSRTVVADRVRFPDGVLAMELQPFEKEQVRTWLEIWGQTNKAGLARRNRTPLPADVALAQGEPARQPLILLLLALYDAADNALQREEGVLARGQLYEAVIRDCADRELAKDPEVRALPSARRRRLVDRELVRLATVALSMFVRGRAVVSETALNRDLPALTGAPGDEQRDEGDWARKATERYFFIHKHQGHGYEFLHATFGEFLVAWLAVYALRDLVRRHGRDEELPGQLLDDDLLYAVTSFSCLAERGPTVGFAMELIGAHPPEARARCVALLTGLLRESLHERPRRSFLAFRPVRHPVPRRLAAYSANLALLIVAASDRPVSVSELLLDSGDFARWSSYAHLWKSQLGGEGWTGLIEAIPARRVVDGGRRDVRLGGSAESWEFEGAGWWFGSLEPASRTRTLGRYRSYALQERPYLLNVDADLLTDPLHADDETHPSLIVVQRASGQVVSCTRLVEEVLMNRPAGVEARVELFADAIAAVTAFQTLRNRRLLDLVLRALALEGPALPFQDRAAILSGLARDGVEPALWRPLLESMFFERSDSWEILLRAGVPEATLREMREP